MADSEDEGADEVIRIHVRIERKIKSDKETMSQDIENIDTYENIAKVYIIQWIPIYEVIDEAYIKESNIFPDDFIRECKNNSNEAQVIPSDLKNNIK